MDTIRYCTVGRKLYNVIKIMSTSYLDQKHICNGYIYDYKEIVVECKNFVIVLTVLYS